jgi:hypothetical protein
MSVTLTTAICRHRRTHEGPQDGQPICEEDPEADEHELESVDASSPENPYLPPVPDMPNLSDTTGTQGLNLHMHSGMQHMDFSHGMIQPQLLQQHI